LRPASNFIKKLCIIIQSKGVGGRENTSTCLARPGELRAQGARGRRDRSDITLVRDVRWESGKKGEETEKGGGGKGPQGEGNAPGRRQRRIHEPRVGGFWG